MNRAIRLRLVMALARWLGVPVDVHQSYFIGAASKRADRHQ